MWDLNWKVGEAIEGGTREVESIWKEYLNLRGKYRRILRWKSEEYWSAESLEKLGITIEYG